MPTYLPRYLSYSSAACQASSDVTVYVDTHSSAASFGGLGVSPQEASAGPSWGNIYLLGLLFHVRRHFVRRYESRYWRYCNSIGKANKLAENDGSISACITATLELPEQIQGICDTPIISSSSFSFSRNSAHTSTRLDSKKHGIRHRDLAHKQARDAIRRAYRVEQSEP